MGRRRDIKPIPQITMNVSEVANEFIEGHMRPNEPKYRVIDRIIGEYEVQKQTIISLKVRIEELEFINQDLKNTTIRQWNKLQQGVIIQ